MTEPPTLLAACIRRICEIENAMEFGTAAERRAALQEWRQWVEHGRRILRKLTEAASPGTREEG